MQLFLSIIASVLVVPSSYVDSVSVRIVPNDTASQIAWVGFDTRGTQIRKGIGPEEVSQPADGVGVTYCAERQGVWLKIEADWHGMTMRASGPCTVVTASPGTGRFSTTGTADPRSSPRP